MLTLTSASSAITDYPFLLVPAPEASQYTMSVPGCAGMWLVEAVCFAYRPE